MRKCWKVKGEWLKLKAHPSPLRSRDFVALLLEVEVLDL
jgi:hypothetical protein